MILPNKDVPFEKSLLKYSLDVLNSINDVMDLDELYKKNNDIKVRDMDAIIVFLYAIGRVDIEDKWVKKIDKKNI